MDEFKVEKRAKEAWDDKACAPYIKDAQGNFICTFDNPRSIGIMPIYQRPEIFRYDVWHYDADTVDGTLGAMLLLKV